jgi:IS1 family transposase
MNQQDRERIDQSDYKRTINELRELNNELFYTELKTNLENHLKEFKDKYEETQNTVNNLDKTVKRMSTNITEEINKFDILRNEFSDKMDEFIQGLQEQYEKLFQDFCNDMSARSQHQHELLKETLKNQMQEEITDGHKVQKELMAEQAAINHSYKVIIDRQKIEFNEHLAELVKSSQQQFELLQAALKNQMQQEFASNQDVQKELIEALQQSAATRTDNLILLIENVKRQNEKNNRRMVWGIATLAIGEIILIVWAYLNGIS